MTTNPTSTTAGQRPRTLPEVLARLEDLLAEAEGYATDRDGYPGEPVAESWIERKRVALRWAQALADSIDRKGSATVSWGRWVVGQFPSAEWELQVKHLRRVISDLRVWQDQLAAFGPAPEVDSPRPAKANGGSPSWMERHGWQAFGALIGLASLAVGILAALRWGPFE